MRRGLVLGGGGLVGMGYHAGALKALDERGLDPAASDVLVGTSAGAIIASFLAAGWTPRDFYDYVSGRHPKSEGSIDEEREEVQRLFQPLYGSQLERARRLVGGIYAATAARGAWRLGVPHHRLRRAFPAGMYSTSRTRARFAEELPEAWPDREILIPAVDLYSGERVAFGSPGAPVAPFPEAVLASTAIPGVFPPVRIRDRYYVDGGVVTATSLDLAVAAGCGSIVCIAPLAYGLDAHAHTRDPRVWGPMALRSWFARSLKREIRDARAKGVHVIVIRPWITELRSHGTNSMRHHDRRAVVEAAREGTLRLLDENSGHEALTPPASPVGVAESTPGKVPQPEPGPARQLGTSHKEVP